MLLRYQQIVLFRPTIVRAVIAVYIVSALVRIAKAEVNPVGFAPNAAEICAITAGIATIAGQARALCAEIIALSAEV